MKLTTKIFTLVSCAALLGACHKESMQNQMASPGTDVDRTIAHGTGGAPDTLKGAVTGTVTLFASKVYILRGLVTVKNGAILNVQAGTLIKGYGVNPDKGTLLVAKGGKLNCKGTANNPVVFTSNESTPTNGDWGGIILLGQAPANVPTTTHIEGIPQTADTFFGGTDENDNSGSITYTRIEYAGGVYSGSLGNNNEVNGLTFGGVGAGTIIDHVQVSYSGDDSFEWFGGSVNPKYLISYKGIDDDFDFDNGYHGHLQFLLGLRDPEINDQSGSKGIECDNDANASFNTPRTTPVISNLTVLGNNGVPDSDPHSPQTSATNVPGALQYDAHFRRTCYFKVRNSVLLGFPLAGLYVDGQQTAQDLHDGGSEFKKNLVHTNAGVDKGFAVAANVTVFTNATLKTFMKSAANGNSGLTNASDAGLVNPFNLTDITSAQFFSTAGSPASKSASFAGSADFDNTANPALGSAVFKTVTYRGAFPATGGADWATVRSGTTGWTKW